MNKEAEKLLEEIKTASGKRQCDVFYYLKADQALAILRTEPEPSKGNKEAIELLEEAKHQGCSGHCVDRINQVLAILIEQPPAGDLAKESIELDKMCISEIVAKYESSHNAIAVLKRKFLEACTRLGRSEARREELLTACEEAQKVFGFIAENYKSAPHFPNAERLVEAAIKSNKGD